MLLAGPPPKPNTKKGHKGAVYGDDENAPPKKPNRQPGHSTAGAPQTAAHPPAGLAHAATPQGLAAPRARPAQRWAHVWGAVHVGTMIEKVHTQEVVHSPYFTYLRLHPSALPPGGPTRASADVSVPACRVSPDHLITTASVQFCKSCKLFRAFAVPLQIMRVQSLASSIA